MRGFIVYLMNLRSFPCRPDGTKYSSKGIKIAKAVKLSNDAIKVFALDFNDQPYFKVTIHNTYQYFVIDATDKECRHAGWGKDLTPKQTEMLNSAYTTYLTNTNKI